MLIKAHGKINLSLDITGRRSDGYHNISSVMQSVALHDDVNITERKDRNIIVTTDHPDLPDGENNIAFHACRQMMSDFHIPHGFNIHIAKRIPLAGGMAGGSADAAAVIRGINALCSLNLSKENMAETGLKIGADVPFCIQEKPALATGIGEELESICGLPDSMWILLVNPGIIISTKQIYGAIDQQGSYAMVDNASLISALGNRDMFSAKENMINVMESVTATLCPQIPQIIRILQSNDALHAMMTGSGATCFGLFESQPDETKFKQIFPNYFVCVTKPYHG